MDRTKQQQQQADAEANTGRWTKEEHDLFLEGLFAYGKDWKQIGSLIKTRTVVQIRTHAQKYFLATKKNEGNPNAPQVTIPPKQSKDKKRQLTVQTTKPIKSKKRKEATDNADEKDEGIENLGKFFDLVDAWSSGSDEGTPTSIDDLDFFKASSFPQTFPDEKDTDGQTQPPVPPPRDSQVVLPAAQLMHMVPPPPPPAHTKFQGNSLATSLAPAYLSDNSSNITSTGEIVQDISGSFDPLPPSIEYGFIGRWMDAMPSMNEPL